MQGAYLVGKWLQIDAKKFPTPLTRALRGMDFFVILHHTQGQKIGAITQNLYPARPKSTPKSSNQTLQTHHPKHGFQI